MNTRITCFLILTFIFVILINGCGETKNNDNIAENIDTKNQPVERTIKLPTEATGVFVGNEPASTMKIGNQKIEIPSSKWRVEISNTSLDIQQVSDGKTIHYTGNYNIQSENDISIVIEGNLLDDKYDKAFKPTLRFNKQNSSWFLDGVAGSEGCVAKKEL